MNIFDIILLEVFILAQQFNNTINKYYNDKLLEKAIMQIKR